MRRRGSTLLEETVVVAIIVTLLGLLLPTVFSARSRAAAAAVPRPSSDWRIRTVKHDEHLFIIGSGSPEFCLHHPDCPCGRKPEAEQ